MRIKIFNKVLHYKHLDITIEKNIGGHKMEISTNGLTEILKNAKDINSFLQENESYITNPTLQEYLKKLLLLKVQLEEYIKLKLTISNTC